MNLSFVKGPPLNMGPSRHAPLTMKIRATCDQLLVAKKLGEEQHVDVECTSDELSAVRSAVHSYRKEKIVPIYVTLNKQDKEGSKYRGCIFVREDGLKSD
jgi:hypothetical protein